MTDVGRRTFLAAGAGSLLLAGCGHADPQARRGTGRLRVRYATRQSDQYADLRLPHATPIATIVLLHGGYWLAQYLADQMDEMAEVLRGAGYAVWNIEYRRLGLGGGWPATFEDVAAGIDHLAKLDQKQTGIDTDDLLQRVVTVGHSAGGQLAVWAASRTTHTPGGPPPFKPDATISLSGVLNLTLASDTGLGGDVVDQLVGGSTTQVPDRYALADPTLMVPAHGPVWAVHAAADEVVPADQASTYVAAADAAGGNAELVTVPGTHLPLILPSGPAWPQIDQLIGTAARPTPA